ncbi:hypothetical protein [Phaeodactylibacter xiamenensis]|uniref:hypothetical protein n=1 Tax=Phaeodactylibacter xiamenensis TaxID=1524460 RepID=UPI0024A937E4|nr:hypothetical protein [Phaeodactylibacter xiamenensis]
MDLRSDISSINALFDIRAETLAAALLGQQDQEVDIEQIVIAPQGSAHRRSSHEVESLHKKRYEQEAVLFMKVHRKGFFDTLPAELFLELEAPYENAIERTKALTQQTKEARKFFLPFEQALYLPRIEAERLEQEWTEQFPAFIEEIWGLPDFADCLNSRQRFLLCYLLPEAYRIAGHLELTGLCFEAIMQQPIDLQFIPPLEYSIPVNQDSEAMLQLGIDATLGSSFKDDIPALEVNIKGITDFNLPDYMEGGKQLRLLQELLYSYFLPLDIPVVTVITVTHDSWSFQLGEGYLGYNIHLQSRQAATIQNETR